MKINEQIRINRKWLLDANYLFPACDLKACESIIQHIGLGNATGNSLEFLKTFEEWLTLEGLDYERRIVHRGLLVILSLQNPKERRICINERYGWGKYAPKE